MHTGNNPHTLTDSALHVHPQPRRTTTLHTSELVLVWRGAYTWYVWLGRVRVGNREAIVVEWCREVVQRGSGGRLR